MTSLSYLLTLDGSPVDASLLEAVRELEVDSSLEAASSFRLSIALSRTSGSDWTVLEDDTFTPLLPIGIRVQVGTGTPSALINGYVASQSVRYGDRPGETVLDVTGLDATMLMNLEEKVTAWADMADSDIASAIFGDHDLVPDVQSTSPVLSEPEGTTIQRGTDIRFLRLLAQRNGFECYVQPEPTTGLDTGVFKPRTLSGAPEAVLSVAVADRSNVAAFSVRHEMTQPTTVTATALDVSEKSTESATVSTSDETALGQDAALGQLDPAPVVLPASTGLVKTANLQTLAQSIVDRSSWSIVAAGEVGPTAGILRPGGIVNVRGAGDAYDGSYFVTRVHHRIHGPRYTQRFEARRNALHATGSEVYV
jgi:phage protein D